MRFVVILSVSVSVLSVSEQGESNKRINTFPTQRGTAPHAQPAVTARRAISMRNAPGSALHSCVMEHD